MDEFNAVSCLLFVVRMSGRDRVAWIMANYWYWSISQAVPSAILSCSFTIVRSRLSLFWCREVPYRHKLPDNIKLGLSHSRVDRRWHLWWECRWYLKFVKNGVRASVTQRKYWRYSEPGQRLSKWHLSYMRWRQIVGSTPEFAWLLSIEKCLTKF